MSYCSVPDCSKDKSAKRKHRFPVYEEEVFNIWINRVANPKFFILGEDQDDRDKRIYKRYYVCDKHFIEECKNVGSSRLKPNSLPTIDLPGFNGEPTMKNSFFCATTTIISSEEETAEIQSTAAEIPQAKEQVPMDSSADVTDHLCPTASTSSSNITPRKRKVTEHSTTGSKEHRLFTSPHVANIQSPSTINVSRTSKLEKTTEMRKLFSRSTSISPDRQAQLSISTCDQIISDKIKNIETRYQKEIRVLQEINLRQSKEIAALNKMLSTFINQKLKNEMSCE